MSIKLPPKLSHTLTHLINKFISRETFGLEKYGKSIDRTDLSLKDFSVHLEEELMDALQYNKRMRDLWLGQQAAISELLRGLRAIADDSSLQFHQNSDVRILANRIDRMMQRYDIDLTLNQFKDPS